MGSTITVSTLTELYATLKFVSGGETILLAPGDYGRFGLGSKSGFDIEFPSTVTIASADPENPASFSSMTLNGVANLAIRDVLFDYTFTVGDIDDFRPFEIGRGSTNISITGSTFSGDNATAGRESAIGYGTGIGLSVRDATNVTVSDNEFFGWKRGMTATNVTNLIVTGNEVHDIRSDGMNFAAVQNVLIEDNYIHDFEASYASGDHRDMIQFWTNGTKRPSTDVVIRGNTLDIGEGSYTQTIFMRNEEVDQGRAGIEMYYQNILIEDNTIYNGHLHGITTAETDGLIIRNNTVLFVPDENNPDHSASSVWVPTIRVNPAALNVVIEDNATAGITGHSGQPTWVVQGNAIVQNTDPLKPGHYSDVFIDSTLDLHDGRHSYVAQPDSLIDTLGAGSAATGYAGALADDTAFFTVSRDAQNGAARIFDAGITAEILGVADQGAQYEWAFSDGTTASGKVVSHAFTAGGHHGATLTVRLVDGTLRTAEADIEMNGSKLLAYNGSKTAFEAYLLGEATTLAPVTSLDGEAIQLGAPGTAATVSRGMLMDLRGSDDFTIDFTLQGDTVGGAGEVFRQHGSFVATISSAGQLGFNIVTDDGKTTTLSTVGLTLNDGLAHDISVQFKDGLLKISADGALNVEQAVSGTLPTSSADLVFGNPWNKTNFTGDLSEFEISIDVGDYPETPQTTVLVPDTLELPPLPPEPEPEVVQDSGMHDAGWEGRVIDIAALAGNAKVLRDSAYVATGPDGAVLHLDGDKDYAMLGRQTAYEHYDRLGFSVDFSRDEADGSVDRLIWNHTKVGLTLTGDGLTVHVATADQGFKGFTARDIGLNDTDLHRAEVMIDTIADRLQVVLDGQVVIDVDDVDFALAGAGGREAGWMIGTPWDRFFDGEVHDFRLGDRFDFLEDYVPAPNAFLS